jgi:hypothetical protein
LEELGRNQKRQRARTVGVEPVEGEGVGDMSGQRSKKRLNIMLVLGEIDFNLLFLPSFL